jgi:hypothetical protein
MRPRFTLAIHPHDNRICFFEHGLGRMILR